MRIARLRIKNFRCIQSAELHLPQNVVLVGDNNSGKSTILEAIDLVLGPERTKQRPVIDEHDFYEGKYVRGRDQEGNDADSIKIRVEATVIGLNEEQEGRFVEHLEFWDVEEGRILDGPPASKTDDDNVVTALRVLFVGEYDEEEDDFVGETYFASPTPENGELERFGPRDKRFCGFLFLRTLRTGSRALSLERGSLLDIILRLREQRVQMWEEVISELRQVGVAEDDELGLSRTLVEVQAKLRSFIPTEWADDPHIRVSDLTRETLRRTLTVFMAAGSDSDVYAVPFRRQGTGTVNMLVFALLSMIAEEKQNVIFAMEEPEIAIPPYTQKRVPDSQPWGMWPLMAVYGIYMALTDGIGKALIADHTPQKTRGAAMGLFYAVTGLTTFGASLLAGVVWDHSGPKAAFMVGASFATLSLLALLLSKRHVTVRSLTS